MAPVLKGAALAAAFFIFSSSPTAWASPTSRPSAPNNMLTSIAPAPEGWVIRPDLYPVPEVIEVPNGISFSLAGATATAHDNLTAPHPSFVIPGLDEDTWDSSPQHRRLRRRATIGPDDRKPQFDMDSMPYRAVGRIQRADGSSCTGALVGPRHVATARHCFAEGQWMTFAPGYSGGAPHGTYQATQIFRSSTSEATDDLCETVLDDVAVVVLGNDRLGDRFGHFGVKLLEENMIEAAPFKSCGYPGDRENTNRPYSQDRITMYDFSRWCPGGGPMITDMDSAGGQSGSPMWLYFGDGGFYSFAVHHGATDRESFGASGEKFVDTVKRARRDFP